MTELGASERTARCKRRMRNDRSVRFGAGVVVLTGLLALGAAGCSKNRCEAGSHVDSEGLCVPDPVVDSGDTGLDTDTGDTDTGDTGDTGETGDSGDSADTGDTGDTAGPAAEPVSFDVSAWVPSAAAWYGLSVAPDGSVWATSTVGLLHLDPATGTSRLYGTADGLLTTSPRAVLAARDGTIWVGEVGTVDQQGEHFSVGADGTLTLLALIDYDVGTEQTAGYRIRQQPFGVGVGDIWMGMNEGACLWDTDLGVFAEHAHPRHPHGATRGLAFTPEGDVWSGDEYQLGRWRYSNDGSLSSSADLFEYWVPWPVELDAPVGIVDVDAADGHIWLASSLYGLARVDVSDIAGASVTTLYDTLGSALAVRALADDAVFIGTAEGLYTLDVATDVMTAHGAHPELAGPVQQLAADGAGSMWLTRPGTLVRLDGVPR